ncbi:hypothetical protein NE237_032962 [Protea cynaroides]|uniref:Uncharacterized protein n=1 Tax=Protea cynaroides TaxID=273540 RepID=A0A9Q0R451_9MAGN|nr:hypothetical protein NE237_032962 [Protea cynaroides]
MEGSDPVDTHVLGISWWEPTLLPNHPLGGKDMNPLFSSYSPWDPITIDVVSDPLDRDGNGILGRYKYIGERFSLSLLVPVKGSHKPATHAAQHLSLPVVANLTGTLRTALPSLMHALSPLLANPTVPFSCSLLFPYSNHPSTNLKKETKNQIKPLQQKGCPMNFRSDQGCSSGSITQNQREPFSLLAN